MYDPTKNYEMFSRQISYALWSFTRYMFHYKVSRVTNVMQPFFFFIFIQDDGQASGETDEPCIEPQEPSENKEQVLFHFRFFKYRHL